MDNPVMDQSGLLGATDMGHAGRPCRLHAPNSGFDSRDGGQLSTCPVCLRTRLDFDCARDDCGMALPIHNRQEG